MLFLCRVRNRCSNTFVSQAGASVLGRPTCTPYIQGNPRFRLLRGRRRDWRFQSCFCGAVLAYLRGEGGESRADHHKTWPARSGLWKFSAMWESLARQRRSQNSQQGRTGKRAGGLRIFLVLAGGPGSALRGLLKKAHCRKVCRSVSGERRQVKGEGCRVMEIP